MNILTAPGKKLLLSGDEAVARAALDKRIAVATGYPGSPGTKTLAALLPIAGEYDITVEWSINEKVALEVASGAAWAGKRSLVSMKMSGINVMADSLLSIAHSGVIGALVIYAVDDVGAYYGMVEQDSRYYAQLASLPLLMPATPQEAYMMALRAFEVSEQVGAPVLVLSTTAVAQTTAAIRVGQIAQKPQRVASFLRDPAKFTKATSQWSREQHKQALARLAQAGELFRQLPDLNHVSWPEQSRVGVPKVGIIVAGVSYTYVQELLQLSPASAAQVALFKLGALNPLPSAELAAFLYQVDSALVLEELEPIIETQVLALAAEAGLHLKIVGKRSGLLPRVGDYTFSIVANALGTLIEHDNSQHELFAGQQRVETTRKALPRALEFCSGCPHRMTYYALNRAIEQLGLAHDEVIVTGDIGCTILGIHEPLNVCWTEVSMGASIGIAQGFKYAGIEKPVIAAMGDGTFYHNGIAGLLNAVQSGVNLTLIILDNSTSAMTGLQPDAGSGRRATGEPSAQANIPMIVRGCGVTHVWELDPYQLVETTRVLQEAINYPGVAVVIAKAPCTTPGLLIHEHTIQVDQERCRVGAECQDTPCYSKVGCPSVLLLQEATQMRVAIDTATCVSCGLCLAACPFEAILPIEE